MGEEDSCRGHSVAAQAPVAGLGDYAGRSERGRQSLIVAYFTFVTQPKCSLHCAVTLNPVVAWVVSFPDS